MLRLFYDTTLKNFKVNNNRTISSSIQSRLPSSRESRHVPFRLSFLFLIPIVFVLLFYLRFQSQNTSSLDSRTPIHASPEIQNLLGLDSYSVPEFSQESVRTSTSKIAPIISDSSVPQLETHNHHERPEKSSSTHSPWSRTSKSEILLHQMTQNPNNSFTSMGQTQARSDQSKNQNVESAKRHSDNVVASENWPVPSSGFYMWDIKTDLGKKAPTCRVFNACVVRFQNSLQFHFPSKLGIHKEHLENCGFINMVFDDPVPSDSEKARVLSPFVLITPSDPQPTLNITYSRSFMRDHDLLVHARFNFPHKHFPHFVDSVIPWLHAVDTISGQDRNDVLCWMLESFSHENTTLHTCQSAFRKQGVQPLLIPVESQRALQKVRISWVPGFLNVLAPDYAFADFRNLFKPHGKDTNESRLCPRSLISTRRTINSFTNNTLSENPLFIRPFVPDRKLNTACTLNIVLIQRKQERVLNNIVEVYDALVKQADILKRTKLANLKVTINIDTLDKSFAQQVALMSALDVAIMAHGAGCTNIMFMKVNAVFIEILAFGYNAWFKDLARAMKLRHVLLTSPPNLQYYSANCPKNIPSHVAEEWSRLYKTGIYTFNNPDLTNATTRICLKRAELEADPQLVVDTVFKLGLETKSC